MYVPKTILIICGKSRLDEVKSLVATHNYSEYTSFVTTKE